MNKKTTIATRLAHLMSEENVTASKLADALGVQASAISHILSERNKPGYDFIVNILGVYPEISPDWLLLGSGSMYRDGSDSKGNTLFTAPEATEDDANQPIAESSALKQLSVINNCLSNSVSPIERVMLFYSDGTVDSYDMRQRKSDKSE